MFQKLKPAITVCGWVERCSEVSQHIHIADHTGGLTDWFQILDKIIARLPVVELKSADYRLDSAGVSTHIVNVLGCRRIGKVLQQPSEFPKGLLNQFRSSAINFLR
jgi:hypothetical protein